MGSTFSADLLLFRISPTWDNWPVVLGFISFAISISHWYYGDESVTQVYKNIFVSPNSQLSWLVLKSLNQPVRLLSNINQLVGDVSSDPSMCWQYPDCPLNRRVIPAAINEMVNQKPNMLPETNIPLPPLPHLFRRSPAILPSIIHTYQPSFMTIIYHNLKLSQSQAPFLAILKSTKNTNMLPWNPYILFVLLSTFSIDARLSYL